jgi:hypothetical protein
MVETYETSLHFVLQDVDRHRKQQTPASAFLTLYPWAYDLDQVDMQIVMNNDLTNSVCQNLKKDAQVFWLSYFKCQAAVLADEFFLAIKELCDAAFLAEYYQESAYLFEQVALKNPTISIRENGDLISTMIKALVKAI